MNFNRYCQISALTLPLFLSGCGSLPTGGGGFFSRQDSAPAHAVDVSNVTDAIPRVEPHSRYGNPESYVVFGKRYHVKKSSIGHVEQGVASWYGTKFHGKRTSSGEPYDMLAMTAAHKSLPLPTYAEVTNLKNGRKIIVKINDRGPFKNNRIIDLSYAAAIKLGITRAGTGLVEVRAIDPSQPPQEKAPIQPLSPVTAPPPTLRTVQPQIAVVAKAVPSPTDKLQQTTPEQAANIYLQVGAFGSRINAENLRARIRDIETLTPSMVSVTQGIKSDSSIFRVRIGPIDSAPEADQVIKRLAQLGIKHPHVIAD